MTLAITTAKHNILPIVCMIARTMFVSKLRNQDCSPVPRCNLASSMLLYLVLIAQCITVAAISRGLRVYAHNYFLSFLWVQLHEQVSCIPTFKRYPAAQHVISTHVLFQLEVSTFEFQIRIRTAGACAGRPRCCDGFGSQGSPCICHREAGVNARLPCAEPGQNGTELPASTALLPDAWCLVEGMLPLQCVVNSSSSVENVVLASVELAGILSWLTCHAPASRIDPQHCCYGQPAVEGNAWFALSVCKHDELPRIQSQLVATGM